MDSYLGKMLELGLEDGGEVLLSSKEAKEMITQKISQVGASLGKGKKARGKKGFDNGMTEEEMIAEQKKLFEKARNYDYSDDEDNNGDSAMNEDGQTATLNRNSSVMFMGQGDGEQVELTPEQIQMQQQQYYDAYYASMTPQQQMQLYEQEMLYYQ